MKLLFTTIALCVLVFSSCKKKNESEAPQIPPPSTFELTTEDFDKEKTTPDTTQTSNDSNVVTTGTSFNWLHGALNVLVWQTAVNLTMAVPVAAFKEAFNHSPKWKSNKKGWLWKYDSHVNNDTYTCELYGLPEGGEVKWIMYISKKGGFKDVKWYEGVSNEGNTAGSWTLYKNANNPSEYLKIDWSKGSTVSNITYTNITSGTKDNGDYIVYEIDNSSNVYNSSYTIFDKSESRIVNIEWNTTSKKGRVIDEKRFNTPDWNCWNEYLIDIDC